MPGRFFVHDMQGDGLVAIPAEDAPFDVVYENGMAATPFDGDWAARSLTKAAYEAKFQQADLRYTAMLNARVKQLQAVKQP
jgi:hypothetical protein